MFGEIKRYKSPIRIRIRIRMCGVGAKPVAHLIKFHLFQWEVIKVKFLINSNMTLTVLNLKQKTDPKVQQDFKGQGH